MQDCEHEFERVLHAASKNPLDLSRTGWPLPPVMSADGQSLLPFHVVPELSVRELASLAGRMAMAGHQNYFGILLSERSGFMRASLKKIFHEEVRFVVNPSQGAPRGCITAWQWTADYADARQYYPLQRHRIWRIRMESIGSATTHAELGFRCSHSGSSDEL